MIKLKEIKLKVNFKLDRVIGIILLIPPLIGVLFFVTNIFIEDPGITFKLGTFGQYWTGGYMINGEAGAGFTSSLPIYLGLMAIAGAYLLKNTDKKD